DARADADGLRPARRPGAPRGPGGGADPTDHRPERSSAPGEIPGAGDSGHPAQPRRQVRRRRGADRPGPGRCRPPADPRPPPGVGRADRPESESLATGVLGVSPRVSLIETITSADPSQRDRPVRELIAGATTDEILRACAD